MRKNPSSRCLMFIVGGGLLGCASAASCNAADYPSSPPRTASTAHRPSDEFRLARCWVPEPPDVALSGTAFVVASAGSRSAPIVVSPTASRGTRAAADTLAQELSRIVGRSFVTTAEPATAGIFVGTTAELPGIAATDFHADNVADREAYVVRTTPTSLVLEGATDQGVAHAVWDFLYQLGYRQYFPGANWEVVPHLPTIRVVADYSCRPAYLQRDLFYGFGTWTENRQPFEDWVAKNRMGASLSIATGHSYQAIIHAYPREFAAHPEYLSRVNGRPGTKFCVSEPGLVSLVVHHAQAYFAKHPSAQSISMEPSDGGGWEGCPGDEKLGSPANRAVTLANAVAKAINSDPTQPRYVGMYAYNQHALPPSLAVDPHVVVFAAGSFLPAGTTAFDVLKGWRAKGEREGGTLEGVREYWAVNMWDRDMPGVAIASSVDRVADLIAAYYKAGARFFTAETSDAWVPDGLGHWATASFLWSADQPVSPDAYRDDFLARAFEGAGRAVRRYFDLIDGRNKPIVSDNLIGELYRTLHDARVEPVSEKVRARLDDLALYVRYLDLWLDYSSARTDPAKQEAFEAVIRYAYRIRRQGVIHSFALYRDLPARDHSVRVPAEAAWNAPGANPWKSEQPVSRGEIDAWIDDGLSRLPSMPSPPTSFSNNLALPSTRPERPSSAVSKIYIRSSQSMVALLSPASDLALTIHGGIIAKVPSIHVRFCPISSTGPADCTDMSVPGDGVDHELRFLPRSPGLYRVEVDDERGGTTVSWPESTPVSLRSGLDDRPNLEYRWTLFFYVPKGLHRIQMLYGGGVGHLLDGHGRPVFRFEGRPRVIDVPVPDGEDGSYWMFDKVTGRRLLLNVPPWLAASPEELLLPEEVLGHPQPPTE